MNVIEFGKDHPETIMLLHGGGLSWWNYREEAEMLKDRFHVVLPVLDGHAGSDLPFTTIEDSADHLLSYIDERLGGSVLLIGGLSLGAQVLLEMLSRRAGFCRAAIVESAAVIPSKLTHALVGPAFGASYGLIKQKWFAKQQFAALHLKPDLFDDYYRDTCRIARRDMIAFMKANTAYALRESVSRCGVRTRVFVGAREPAAVRRSAVLIRDRIPGSTLTVLPGFWHGDFSVNHAAEYVKAIEDILKGD